MLAMGFVSALLILVAATVIQVSKIYNRGLLLKSVDEAASKITNDLTREISSSSSDNFTYIGGENNKNGGRLCTGKYTYIWNYAEAINESALRGNNVYSDNQSDVIRFVKIPDANNNYCSDTTAEPPKNISTELLGSSDLDLALYELSVKPTKNELTGQNLYAIHFRLGTDDQEAITNATCKNRIR
jgi:hypothetical protein